MDFNEAIEKFKIDDTSPVTTAPPPQVDPLNVGVTGSVPAGQFERPLELTASVPQVQQSEPEEPQIPPNYDLIGNAIRRFSERPEIDARDNARKSVILKYVAENALEPGRAKEVAKYAAASEMDPRFVDENLEEIRKRYRYAGFDWESLLETHPVFTDLVGNPSDASLVMDDSATLTRLESVLTGKWEMYDAAPDWKKERGLHEWAPRLVTPPAWAAAVRDAFTGDIDLLAYQAQTFLGLDPGLPEFDPMTGKRYGVMTPMEEQRARDLYEQYLREHSTGMRNYVGAGVGTIESAKRVVANSFLFPFKAAPMIAGATLTGGLGEVLFATEGIAAGMTFFNTLWTAPGIYDRFSQIKTAEGEQISPTAARVGTIVGAPLVGWVMTKGLTNVLTGPAEKAIERAGVDTIQKALSSRGMMLALGEFGARTGVHVMEGAAGFAMQSGMEAAVEQLTRSWALGETADPNVVTAAMWEGFKQGLADMPALAMWHPGRILLQDMGMMRRAAETRTKWRIMTDAKEAAKHPEIAEKMAAGTAAKPGAVTHTYLDREVFDTTAQAAGLDPREVMAEVMGDKGAAYDRAVAEGAADLSIPFANAMKHLVGSRVFGEMIEVEGRFDPADYSFAKVAREVERWAKIADEASALSPDKMDKETKAIFDAEFVKAFEALDHPSYQQGRDKMAEAHARKVISIVVGLKERTKVRAPDVTITEWYAKTFGKQGIWKADIKVTDVPIQVGDEIAIDEAGRKGRVTGVGKDSLTWEGIGGYKASGGGLIEHYRDFNLGTKRLRELVVDISVDISAGNKERFAYMVNTKDPTRSQDSDWAGMTWTEMGRTSGKPPPVEWVDVRNDKTAVDDLGRQILMRSKDGRWRIIQIPDSDAVSIHAPDGSMGRFEKSDQGSAEDIARGVVAEYATPARHNILIRDNGYKTILAHEFAHAFSRVLRDLSREGDELKQLYDQMAQAMGYKDGAERDAGAISAREERLAHAFEQYLVEGKSPSIKLAGVFARFAQWGAAVAKQYGYGSPGEIYARQWARRFPAGNEGHKIVTGEAATEPPKPGEPAARPVEPLTPALREFFNVFLASTDEIKQAQETVKAGMPFPKAVENMTDAEKKAYAEQIKGAERSAQNLLLKQIVEAGRRENAKFLQEQLDKITKEVRERAMRDPRYAALHFFRTGKFWDPNVQELLLNPDGKPYRFYAQDLIDRFGKGLGQEYVDLLRSLDRSAVTVDPKMGLDADMLAKLLGFDQPTGWTSTEARESYNQDIRASASAVERMLAIFRTALPLEEHVQRESMAILRERFQTDLLDHPEQLQQRALDAVINEKMALKVIKELNALARQLDPDRVQRSKSISPQMMEALAERLVRSKTLREIRPEQYVRALGLATTKARDFAKSNEIHKAWDATEAALLNIFMYKAARRIENDMQASYSKLAERATSPQWRSKLGLADRAYRDLHDAILKAIGMLEGMEEGVDRSRALDTFLKAVEENDQGDMVDGWNTDLVRGVLSGTKPWKDLRPSEAANVFNAIINIAHIAEERNGVRIGKEKAALDTAASALRTDLEKLSFKGKAPADMALVKHMREPLLKLESYLANSEEFRTLIDKMGPAWKKYVWDPYIQAKFDKFDLQTLVTDTFEKAYKAMPEEIRKKAWEELKGLDRVLPIPDDVNLAGPRSRSWLWMVALNIGNEGNLKRLLQGFGWTYDAVIKAIEENLSPEEMSFIQKIWDLSDKELWPRIVAKEEKRVGLPPEQVIAAPFKLTFDGKEYEYRGGYFPAKYDRRAGQRAINEGIERTSEGPVRMKPGTRKSYTKARVENYSDIVNLEWSVLPSHIAEVIHDLAYDQWVRSTNKLIFNKKFKIPDTLYQRLGEEGAKQPRAFLEATAWEQSDPAATHMARVLGIFDAGRSRIVYSGLGYSVPVALADFLHPIAVAAFGQIKMGDMSVAFARMNLVQYAEMRAFAEANSKEILIRASHSDAKLREELLIAKRAGAPSKWTRPIDVFRRNAFILLDHSDRMVSTVIWTAKYREVMRDGMKGLEGTFDERQVNRQLIHEEAVRQANDALNRSMPSHMLNEMPAMLRDRRTMGALMIFQGYYSKLLQMSLPLVRDTVNAWKGPNVNYGHALGVTAESAIRIAAALGVASVLGDYIMGHGKEDDETWGEWFARKSLVAPFTLLPLGSTLADPLADIAISGKIRQISIRNAPAFAAAQQIYNTVGRLASNTRTDSQKFWDILETTLFATRLPARQVRRTGQYVTDLMTGDESPEGALDLTSGMIYGQRRKQPANPIQDLGDVLP